MSKILNEENIILLGAEVIQLQVSEFNKTAVDFYKSLGMTVWEYKMEQRI